MVLTPTLRLSPNPSGREGQVKSSLLGDVTETLGVERRSIRPEERSSNLPAHDGPCARWSAIRSVLHRRHRGVEQLISGTLTTLGDRLQSSEGRGVEISSGEVSLRGG